ncbi:MAG: hypothetical protein V1824_04085 [archaeon]
MISRLNKKGLVSLEYLLIFLAVISVLSIIIYQAINLYEKNLEIIDKQNLNEFYNNLQQAIELSEIENNFSYIIDLKPLSNWEIENKTLRSITLKNKTKEYIITSSTFEIVLSKEIISKTDSKIILEKKNSKIYITIK